jgi:hypothetical protein
MKTSKDGVGLSGEDPVARWEWVLERSYRRRKCADSGVPIRVLSNAYHRRPVPSLPHYLTMPHRPSAADQWISQSQYIFRKLKGAL